MADGNVGERVIVVDLTVTGARVLRDALKGEHVQVSKITVAGTGGAAPADIVLRKESASGPIVAAFRPTPSVINNADLITEDDEFICKGLYLDNVTQAWTAGSLLLIYTR